MRLYLAAAMLLVVALTVVPATANTIFSDGFESGVSGSTWEVMPGNSNYQILNGDSAHAFGSGSAKQVDADPAIYYMRTKAGAITAPTSIAAGTSEILTAYIWDDMWSTTPVAGGVMFSDGTATDFFQLSVNSTYSLTNYCYRTAKEGTFVSSVARSQGWHKFQIAVNPYTGNAGDVVFAIDDQPVYNGLRKGDYTMNQVRLGISVKTYQPFWFDNVSVDVVPEPASLLGLGAGLVGLLGLAKRRMIG